MITQKILKERPILFRGPMVKAILEGRKTQTRRIIKGVNENPVLNKVSWQKDGWYWDEGNGCFFNIQCPYGQPGDRLWVRETFVIENGGGEYCIEAPTDGSPFNKITVSDGEGGEQEAIEIPHFRATEPDAEIYSWDCMEGDCDHNGDEDECNKTRWKSAIHMPRWASRIDLEVVKIRVERLQDISEEDAKAEGIESVAGGFKHYLLPSIPLDPINSFRTLWESINGYELHQPKSWAANPWVWVVEFKRIRP